MIQGKLFEGKRFEQQEVEGEQFADCRVIGNNFSWLDLSESHFVDCRFYERELGYPGPPVTSRRLSKPTSMVGMIWP